MNSTCHTVLETETVSAAAKAIVGHQAINLPVIDSQNRLVGLFGIYDLLAMLVPRVAMIGDLLPNLRFMGDDVGALHRAYAELADRPISQVMNREPVSVFPDTPIVEGVRLFCLKHMTIPVVERDTGRLVGLISYWDAARAITGAP